MEKRGTNIYKRKDGRWEARYIAGIRPDGTKKYRSVYAADYRTARAKQIIAMNDIRISSGKSNPITLSDLMLEWLDGIGNTVKKATYEKYKSTITCHIEKDIGKYQVRYLTGKIIDNYADGLLNSDCPLSAKTVNDILVVIGQGLSYVEEEYGIIKPKFHRFKEQAKEMRVLSVQEQSQLEHYLIKDMDYFKFGVYLALYTGMRISELCALQWKDISKNDIRINKTLHRIKDGCRTIVEFTEPKTKASNRTIPIPTFLLPMIAKFRAEGSVLKTTTGGIVEPRLMQMKFAAYIHACGIPKTNFHALRHTFATRCVEVGFDIKSLSEILGHSDVKTTLNKYVHSSFDLKRQNMERLKTAVNF